MPEFKNVSGTPEDLEGGRVVGVGEMFTLSADAAKDPYNKAKIEDGKFIEVDAKPKKGADS